MPNQKDLRIKKLWERGNHSTGDIARRIGYGGAIEQGIKRVEEGLVRLGIRQGNGKMETDHVLEPGYISQDGKVELLEVSWVKRPPSE